MSSRITASSHVVTAIRGGSAVLLDLRGGRYYTLEEVGTEIWQLLPTSGGLSRGQILEVLASKYDAAMETLAADLGGFIGALARAGLVEVQ